MPITVAPRTLAQAVNELDTYNVLDNDAYIDNSSTWVGSGGRNQDLADLLWEASRQVYDEARFYYANASFTPTATDNQFDLASSAFGACFSRIEHVMVNGSWLYDGGGRRGLLSIPRFERVYSGWRTAADGKPIAAMLDPQGYLTFNCPFSTDCVNSGDFAVAGFGWPRQFNYATGSGSAWAVALPLQRAVILRAAVNAKLAYATEGVELGLLDRWRMECDEEVAKFRDESQQQLSVFQDSTNFAAGRDRVWL